MSIYTKLFGDISSKTIARIRPIVERVNALEPDIQKLDMDGLKAKTAEFKERLRKGETLDDILPEAFALVRETALRTLHQRHYDVQIMGGIILHNGAIAEMRTGEGKTLVATLPAYLNALGGSGVHVVTVNDYLSRRDAAWMGQIYHALGLTVSVVNHDSSFIYDPSHDSEGDKLDQERDVAGGFKVVHELLRPCTRRDAYAADITYGTNNEFGFDYLRDNLEYDQNNLRQRVHNFAIVDEIDSILIDEARTPLIISAPYAEAESLYQTFSRIASKMEDGVDFTKDEKMKAVQITEEGIEHAEKLLGISDIYTEKGIKYVHHLETALRAKAFFEKDKEYVVRDGEIIIVDEFTGRMQPGRRWSEGLHQAIEAKEGVKIKEESRTFATISFQNYFRLYKKLSGMTGTAATSSEEFHEVYNLDTVAVPTHRENKRKDADDLIYQTEKGKWTAVVRRIKELNEKGQPVLVGTVSIEKNEFVSALLSREGIKHEVLNAKNHEREGEIIAQAGRGGGVTIATNMAGRGVDIIPGGNPVDLEQRRLVLDVGGLFVIGTERHEARRIDNQLRGRSGRQGDPGETQFFVSLEDSLMRVFASDTIKNLMGRFGIPEDEPIQNRLVTRALESAQAKIEGLNFDARKHLLEYDNVMNRQRITVYDRRRKILLGGTEYAESFMDEMLMYLDEAEQDKVLSTIEEQKKIVGEQKFWEAVRILALQVIDMLWVEHLETMDYMRQSVRLRAYGQRDPLVEYKREGLRLFKEFESTMAVHVFRMLPAIGGAVPKVESEKLEEVHESAQLIGGNSGNPDEKPIVSGVAGHMDSVGRNDPCPCGSGKKYKKCHGK